MTPQLWINYRLKSVEHINFRVLLYRFLNTIIDDLFALIITMPTMHRLSCFRDDVVFVIYLYQRWLYPAKKRGRREESGEGQADGPQPPNQAPESEQGQPAGSESEGKSKGQSKGAESTQPHTTPEGVSQGSLRKRKQ